MLLEHLVVLIQIMEVVVVGVVMLVLMVVRVQLQALTCLLGNGTFGGLEADAWRLVESCPFGHWLWCRVLLVQKLSFIKLLLFLLI